MAVDGSGNVFVADTNNNAVKEIVAVNGSIPTLPVIRTLGSGFNHPFGVAVDGSGNVFVAGNADMNVTEIVAVNGNIPASPTLRILGSGFSYPLAVEVDASGNVFVGDWGNHAVKEIVAVNGSIPASPTIRTWTGGFSAPYGLAVDPLGNVFIGDAYNNAVKEMLAVNGSVPASPAIVTLGSGFSHPNSVAVDGSGNVFVADGNNNAVKELPYAAVPSLSFAATPVGSTSSDSPQTVTVANDGNADLSFAVPATGLNPSLSNNSFALDSGSDCPQLDASSSAAPVSSGMVTFLNGTISIGIGALNAQGVATLATTTLPVGSNTIIATYAATTDYNASTSSAEIVAVAVTVVPILAPSYTLTASPASLTIVRGQSGATTLALTPAGGFTGTLTLSCGNLPAYVTCAFAQNSITLTGNDQPVHVGLALTTNVQQTQLAALPTPTPLNPLLPAMVFWLPAGMAGLAIRDKRKRSPKLRRWLQLCLLLAATGAVAAGMMGCNTGSPWTTPVGTSNVVVVATPASGNGQSLSLSMTITQ